LAERVEVLEFTVEQCFFLRTRPAFELGFTMAGLRERGADLKMND
jgi:hypothetical protein